MQSDLSKIISLDSLIREMRDAASIAGPTRRSQRGAIKALTAAALTEVERTFRAQLVSQLVADGATLLDLQMIGTAAVRTRGRTMTVLPADPTLGKVTIPAPVGASLFRLAGPVPESVWSAQ